MNPLSRLFVRRFVAGETLESAVEVVRTLNAAGLAASLDPLGENVTRHEEAERAVQAILGILEAIHAGGLDSTVSIKLTQAGLDIDPEFCAANVQRILDAARPHGIGIQLDMEGTPYTERTLALYRKLRSENSHVGAVIQAYLRRTRADADLLCEIGGNIRLCKGAYREPPELAFSDKAEVDRNYREVAKILFSREARAKGTRPNIATHDERILDWTREHVRANQIAPDAFEFQMLYGIRRDLQESLAKEGFRVRVYVPFGRDWYPYFMRRLAERPANVFFLIRNLWRA